MSPSAPVSSISTSRLALTAARASLRAKLREHLVTNGAGGYVLVWVAYPFFTLATAGLVYRGHNPALLRYAVVGIACSAFLTNALFYVGQILDEERMQGTLINLFLAPCPRAGWLTGFACGGLLETMMSAGATLSLGMIAFGVRFHPDLPALLLSFLLFLLSLWGMGLVFSALGLVLKRSNDLANLVSSFLLLLGGIYYPVTALPAPLRYPAEALPLGYGIEALTRSSLYGAGIPNLLPQLVPLAGFALVLPLFGALAFRWIERKVRRRGELELY